MQFQKSYRQKGMSLIEVLISMLIIGMGLGMSVSMIQASNRYAEEAENRAIALNQIQSIVSSMKANALGGPAYITQTGENLGDNDDNPDVLPLTDAQITANARAAADLITWQENLPIVLPGGAATITANNRLYTVTVTWNEQGKIADDEDSDSSTTNNENNQQGRPAAESEKIDSLASYTFPL